MQLHISGSLSFADAAERYLALRTAPSDSARYIRESTEHSYRQYAASLALFFGERTLDEIRWGDLRAYQAARVAGAPPFIRRRRPHEAPGPCPAKPAKVNQELRLLVHIKKLAGCWMPEDEAYYEELREDEPDTQRALTREEQAHWLAISAQKPRWEVLHWYSVIAFDTGMSTNEIRGLRLGDVDVARRLVDVSWASAKNRHRRRTVAVEDEDTLRAFRWLRRRARRLGAHEETDYLFPFRNIRANRYVPERPMTVHGIRAAWLEVRKAAGVPWFRPYDTRHTSITRMAEAGMPIEVIRARVGHVSDRMSRHYTHISLSTQREWAHRLAEMPRKPVGVARGTILKGRMVVA